MSDNLLLHLAVKGLIAGIPEIEEESKWPLGSKTLIDEQKIKLKLENS
jgi:hypothetical protein